MLEEIQKDATLAEILTGLMRKADPLAKSPDDVTQRLLWVVGPDPDAPTKQVIIITTRKAAEAKKYTLPEVFVLKK